MQTFGGRPVPGLLATAVFGLEPAKESPTVSQRDSNELCLEESTDTSRITVWYD